MRRPRFDEPVAVRVGSVWLPRWASHPRTPLKVIAQVDRPNGTNFVVKSLETGEITRLISYKQLMAYYLEQASVE